MVQRSGGIRRKSRHKLTKNYFKKGKIKISEYLKKLNKGDRVQVLLEPAIQKGSYALRYYGKYGINEGPQGDCYKIRIKDGNKEKFLIVHPVHLKKV